jgi:hypothetical protein
VAEHELRTRASAAPPSAESLGRSPSVISSRLAPLACSMEGSSRSSGSRRSGEEMLSLRVVSDGGMNGGVAGPNSP